MKNSKILTFIIALFAAVCLWIYVVAIVNPDGETTISGIPVVFTGEEVLREDQKLIITEGYDATLSATFSGKNTDIKKLIQVQKDITAVVDVTKIRGARQYSMAYELILPSSVQSSAYTVSGTKPEVVMFTVQSIVTKPIPVRVDFSDVKIAEGYMLESTSQDYESVMVEGPEEIVNSISSAVVLMERTGLNKSVTSAEQFTLVDQNGEAVDRTELKVDLDAIEVTMNVVMYKDVPLNVTIISGGGATEEDITREISPKMVTLSGDPSVVQSINSIELGTIDLGDMLNNTDTFNFAIVVPGELKSVSGEEEAEVTVKIKNKKTANLRATNITFANKPEGFDATSMTQQVQVTVRAATLEINRITPTNLRVVADLSDYTKAGTYTVPVSVMVDGFDDAGVVGEYSIVVSLTPAEEK